MQRLAFVIATMTLISPAIAGDMEGRHHGGDWDRNAGVLVDVPMPQINYGNQNPQAADPNYQRCRDSRHICFDQWGVSEPGYGRCMTARGC
jgi:hypothetical protein